MRSDDIMSADKTIKMDLARFVLKLQVGEEITLNEADFKRLSKAFFDETERTFL
jgi:hypothetical protein